MVGGNKSVNVPVEAKKPRRSCYYTVSEVYCIAHSCSVSPNKYLNIWYFFNTRYRLPYPIDLAIHIAVLVHAKIMALSSCAYFN